MSEFETIYDYFPDGFGESSPVDLPVEITIPENEPVKNGKNCVIKKLLERGKCLSVKENRNNRIIFVAGTPESALHKSNNLGEPTIITQQFICPPECDPNEKCGIDEAISTGITIVFKPGK